MPPASGQTENLCTPFRERVPKFGSHETSESIRQVEESIVAQPDKQDWSRPQAMAIPKEGYFEFQQGKFGPVFPKTPACYGFTIIARIKPGREGTIREHGKTLEKALEADPDFLAPLKLHYLRWVL